MEYMTDRLEGVFMSKLCCGDEHVDPVTRVKARDQLERKYDCYKLLEHITREMS